MNRSCPPSLVALAALSLAAAPPPAGARQAAAPPAQPAAPSASLMATNTANADREGLRDTESHALRDQSMFAITPPEPRTFELHDLVQIVVRETSRAESTHELDTQKKYFLDGSVSSFPILQLGDLPLLQAGDPDKFPIDVGVNFDKKFDGQGDYKREDDLTARLTAEVIEILPNGNLILEARTFIKNDEEEMSIKVTGICRQDDVSPVNTILSNQIHDLHIEKVQTGELKKANEKGVIARVLDAIFAF